MGVYDESKLYVEFILIDIALHHIVFVLLHTSQDVCMFVMCC